MYICNICTSICTIGVQPFPVMCTFVSSLSAKYVRLFVKLTIRDFMCFDTVICVEKDHNI